MAERGFRELPRVPEKFLWISGRFQRGFKALKSILVGSGSYGGLALNYLEVSASLKEIHGSLVEGEGWFKSSRRFKAFQVIQEESWGFS